MSTKAIIAILALTVFANASPLPRGRGGFGSALGGIAGGLLSSQQARDFEPLERRAAKEKQRPSESYTPLISLLRSRLGCPASHGRC